MGGRQPTYVIWAVQKNGDKGFWTSIGAALAHEDGDEMSLKLSLLPLARQDVVIRKGKPKTTDQTDEVPY
jgi:hypothetical protein